MMIQALGTRREALGARYKVGDADLSLNHYDGLLSTEAWSCQMEAISVFSSCLVPRASRLSQS